MKLVAFLGGTHTNFQSPRQKLVQDFTRLIARELEIAKAYGSSSGVFHI